jgi:hypothetical protein
MSSCVFVAGSHLQPFFHYSARRTSNTAAAHSWTPWAARAAYVRSDARAMRNTE